MRLQSRLDSAAAKLKERVNTATVTFMNADGEVVCQHKIPGKESFIFIDDFEDDGR